MTSHSQKGGRPLDNSCSLCVKTWAWPQCSCSISCYARGSYWLHTQYRMRLRTMRIILGVFCVCLYTILTPKMTPRIGICESLRVLQGVYSLRISNVSSNLWLSKSFYKTSYTSNSEMASLRPQQMHRAPRQYTDPLGSAHGARVSKNTWASPLPFCTTLPHLPSVRARMSDLILLDFWLCNGLWFVNTQWGGAQSHWTLSVQKKN